MNSAKHTWWKAGCLIYGLIALGSCLVVAGSLISYSDATSDSTVLQLGLLIGSLTWTLGFIPGVFVLTQKNYLEKINVAALGLISLLTSPFLLVLGPIVWLVAFLLPSLDSAKEESDEEDTQVHRPSLRLSWEKIVAWLVVSCIAGIGFYWLLWGNVSVLERVLDNALLSVLLYVRSMPDWLKGAVVGVLSAGVARRVTRSLPLTKINHKDGVLAPGKGAALEEESTLEINTLEDIEQAFQKYLAETGSTCSRKTLGENTPPAFKVPEGYILFVDNISESLMQELSQRSFFSLPRYVFTETATDEELDTAMEAAWRYCLYVVDRQLKSQKYVRLKGFEQYLSRHGVEFQVYTPQSPVQQSTNRAG